MSVSPAPAPVRGPCVSIPLFPFPVRFNPPPNAPNLPALSSLATAVSMSGRIDSPLATPETVAAQIENAAQILDQAKTNAARLVVETPGCALPSP